MLQQVRTRIGEKVQNALTDQAAVEQLEYGKIRPLGTILRHGHVATVFVDESDPVVHAIGADDLLANAGNRAVHLAADHTSGTGLRGHQGKQAAACTDVEDDLIRCRSNSPFECSAVAVVAAFVQQHGDVPAG